MTAPKPAKPLRLTGRDLAIRNDRIDRRDMQRCAFPDCGVIIWENGSRHHRKFKSRRGGDEVSNGVLLCGSGTTGCHGWAHANPEAARALGFAVGTDEDPRQVPIHHAIHGWVYLDDFGGFTREEPAPVELEAVAA